MNHCMYTHVTILGQTVLQVKVNLQITFDQKPQEDQGDKCTPWEHCICYFPVTIPTLHSICSWCCKDHVEGCFHCCRHSVNWQAIWTGTTVTETGTQLALHSRLTTQHSRPCHNCCFAKLVRFKEEEEAERHHVEIIAWQLPHPHSRCFLDLEAVSLQLRNYRNSGC